MPTIKPIDAKWLDQVHEAPIEPARRIVDPHHHLWRRDDIGNYVLDELWADTSSGHNVEKTVFVECGASYRTTGPEYMRCVGETEFVAEIAAASAKGGRRKAVISAIVAHADLTRGAVLEEVLAAHDDAGNGLFRGIRHAGALDPHPEELMIAGRALPGLYARKDFRDGVQVLGARANVRHLALPPPEPRIRRTRARRPRYHARCSITSARRSASAAIAISASDLRGVEERHRRDRAAARTSSPSSAVSPCRTTASAGTSASAGQLRRAGRRRSALLPARDRVLRPGALHVREQLPGRQALDLVSRCCGTR